MRRANENSMGKRFLSVLLAMLMLLCVAPLAIFAEDGNNGDPAVGVTNNTNIQEGDALTPNSNNASETSVVINAANFPDANFRTFVAKI